MHVRRWTLAPWLLVLPLVFVAGARAQQALPQRPAGSPAAPAAAQGPKASEKFVNLEVLGDIPASQMGDAMVFMAASLGFTCESCHVRKPDGEFAWEKDDKENKQAARRMLALTRGLNAKYFDNRIEVTCSTCHQGRRSPVNQGPLVQPFTPDQIAQQAAMAALPPGARPPAPKESAEQVIAKYLDAIGGQAALQKVTSVVMRGTATNRAGQVSPITVSEKMPGAIRIATESKPAAVRASDGSAAWVRTGDAVRDLNGVRALAVLRDESPWLGARLSSWFTRWQGGRYDRIDGRDVITLNGSVSPETSEALSFDRESGLLVRRVARLNTVMGRLSLQIDYADYRPVGGVKVPFEVKTTDWESVTTVKFAEVKLNAPVDASAFAK